jgi:non-specific protein-tyrosine kinase
VTTETSYDVNVRAYLAALRRQSWLIVAVTALGLLVGLAYAAIRPSTYVSTATVEVKPLTTQPLEQTLDQKSLATLVSTEKQVAMSTEVAQLAAQKLGSPEGPDALLGHLSVETPGDTNVLSFSYSSGDPASAREGAQAFADAYVAVKQRDAVQTFRALHEALREQIQGTMDRIAKVSSKVASSSVAATPGSPARTLRASLVSKLSQLWAESASLTPLVVEPAQVIEPAQLPAGPTSPAPIADVVAGGLLGLAAGSGLALLRNRRGGRWRGAVDLEEPVGAPVIGMIPKLPGKTTRRGALVTLGDRTPASEAFRQLRAHVLTLGARGVKTLAITSPMPDEGKSTTAVNLAVALAQAGKRTILVSADVHARGVERFFDLRTDGGLSSVLSGATPLGDALRFSGIDDLWVLPSGDARGDGSEIIQPAAVDRLLRARDLVDFIVVDCPPLFAVADTLTFAPLVDGVALVAHARRTRRGAIERAKQELEQVQARLVGIILGGVPAFLGPRYDGYVRSGRRVALGSASRPRGVHGPRRTFGHDGPASPVESGGAWLHEGSIG